MVLPSSFAEIDPILVLPGQFYLKPHSLLRPLIAHYTVSIERNSYGTSSPAQIGRASCRERVSLR